MNLQTLLVAVLTLAPPAFAEHGKWHAEFLKHWTVSKEFTLAVAELMPADGYDSRPNAEEMKFGELMVHIAEANNRNFALIAGVAAPPKPAAAGREIAMKYLGESFDFCARIAEGLTEEQLDKPTGPAGRPGMTARERMWAYFTHTAHHRGQAEVYLRVKNIKPPQYRF